MTAAAYRAALASLGLTRLTAAEWLDVNEKTIRRWGKDGPPKQIAMLLERELEARQLTDDGRGNAGGRIPIPATPSDQP